MGVSAAPRKPAATASAAITTDAAEDDEHPAPADEIANDAREGRAEQIAAHRSRQCAPDGDLALVRAQRGRWSGRGQLETRRPNRCRQGCALANSREKEVASAPMMLAMPSSAKHSDHQARLAEQIGGRPNHGLDHARR